MTKDPYSVLGISPGATQDEIKKAYRQKTKECHPDMHPDDPHAEEKMAEVNAAYDMLMNPEKYQGQSAGSAGGSYSGYRSYRTVTFPEERAGDHEQVRMAISFMRQRRFTEALDILDRISQEQRNGRWYYLSAFANGGLGNLSLALSQIQQAMQLEPNNQEYQTLYMYFVQTSQSYRRQGEAYQMNMSPAGYCAELCLANLFCNLCFC